MLNLKKNISLLVILFLVIIVAGCGKKKEAPEQKTEPQAVQQDTVVKEVPKAPEVKLPDLTGTWTGSTQSKSTVMKISEMDGLKFKGSITMNFRNPISNSFSGTIDTAKKSFTMSDLQRARFAGSYAGKFSEDFTKMSGTFTIKADGQKFNFTLVKK